MQVQGLTNLADVVALQHLFVSFVKEHPYQATLYAKAAWDAIVGSLPAPTATSGAGYVFVFKVLNSLAFNFHRAANTSIENSPNFMPAVVRYISQSNPEDVARILRGETPITPPSPQKP